MYGVVTSCAVCTAACVRSALPSGGESMALNEQERYQAQMGLIDAHRVELYLTLIAERARFLSLFVSIITGISALGSATFAGILLNTADFSSLQLAGLLAGSLAGLSSVVGIVLDYSKRATKAAAVAKECALLVAEWRTMVISSNGYDYKSLELLAKRQKEVEASASGEVPYKKRLNKRASSAAKARVAHEIHHKSLEELSR